MTSPIYFYRTDEPYGEFSNFSPHPIVVHGVEWPTSEHYFQAQKFADTEHEELIRHASTPGQAAKMGRDRNRPLRADWEEIRKDVMKLATYCKFTQHPELRQLLLDTGDAWLVERTTDDHYWGDGGDGSGQNMLGRTLMDIRNLLKQEQQMINVCQQVLSNNPHSWVLFEYGTFVILQDPADNLCQQAIELLQEWGPVHPGSSSGDFNTIPLHDDLGWLVTCHHNDIQTLITRDEVGVLPEGFPESLMIGTQGRSRRAADADRLAVIHVEDNRKDQ